MKKLAVHFGAGALGRGLTLPLLVESGFDVVAVDADPQLIAKLQQQQGYSVAFTDLGQQHFIRLLDSCHPADSRLAAYLAQAELITTSVRQENLHHVAAALRTLTAKTVICCENIAESGSVFARLLQQQGVDTTDWALPDCMVDRICSAAWPASTDIEAESYGAIVVAAQDHAVIPARFEASANLEARFQEKRILVNTYADGVAFLGQAAGLHYLFQAASDETINQQIAGYMQVMKQYLHQHYQLDNQHLNKMAAIHRQRLQNTAIRRELTTVARNFLAKMAPGERFILPLISQLQQGEDISPALPFLQRLINGWVAQQADTGLARQQVYSSINNSTIINKIEEYQ